MFYGEDPANTKPEDFFGTLVSFSTMLQKSQVENEALAKRLSKSQQLTNNKVYTITLLYIGLLYNDIAGIFTLAN